MSNTSFPRELYLRKIGLSGPPAVTFEGLRELHRAQLFHLPFENLDPFLGRSVSLEPARLFEKMLERRRGGYCFELNTLFLLALKEFGFQASPLLGRVFLGRPQAGPRTHQAAVVLVEGKKFLADVGFGGPGLIDPIPLEAGFEGYVQGRKIRLRSDPDFSLVYEDHAEGGWRIIYALPEERVEPIDLEVGNHYCATHPHSVFRAHFYLVHHLAHGKITLSNRKLTRWKEGVALEEKQLQTEEDFRIFFSSLGLAISDEDVSVLQKKIPLL